MPAQSSGKPRRRRGSKPPTPRNEGEQPQDDAREAQEEEEEEEEEEEKKPPPPLPPRYGPRNKSLCVAYLLWACGGLVGLHHLYLERDVHAALYAASFGGFGVGWLADLFRMPALVRGAREREEDVAAAEVRMRFNATPDRGVLRTLAMIVMAAWLATVFSAAAAAGGGDDGDDDEATPAQAALSALGCALGVYLVGVADGTTVSTWWGTVAGAVAGRALTYAAARPAGSRADVDDDGGTDLDNASVYGALFCFFYWRRWRTRERPAPWRTPRRGCCYRAGRHALAAGVAAMVLGAAAVNTITFTDEETGERSTLRETLEGARNSEAWQQVTGAAGQLWEQARREGVYSLWEELRRHADPDDVRGARAELGVSEDATEAEVKHAYRRLAREWHPDKNPERLEEAEARMAAINRAYEALQRVRRREAMRDEVRAEAADEAERAQARRRRRKERQNKKKKKGTTGY